MAGSGNLDIHIGVCGTPGCHDPECSIPYGLCHCGCGEKTNIANRSDTKMGNIKSLPKRYLRSHGGRGFIPSSRKDITGQRFGRLVALDVMRTGKKSYWRCKCDCGNESMIMLCSLTQGRTRSCGCLSREVVSQRMRKDITGQRFGRLTALSVEYRNWSGHWLCQCDCGQRVTVEIRSLMMGNTKSCGCLRSEMTAERTRVDLTGQKFGRLLALSVEYEDKKGFWTCLCDCGMMTRVTTDALISLHTQSCGCLMNETFLRMEYSDAPVTMALVKRHSDWPNVYFDDRLTWRPWVGKVNNPNGGSFYFHSDDELKAAQWAMHKKLELGHKGREKTLKMIEELEAAIAEREAAYAAYDEEQNAA